MNEERRLVGCFKQVFPQLPEAEIRESTMKRLGAWDSAALLTLLARVEKEFSVRFDLEQVNTFTSFAAILNAVQPMQSQTPSPHPPRVSWPVLSDNPWISSYQPVPDAKVRLLCFPHAGSSAAAYGLWPAKLPRDVEVCPIEYPGRGSRRSERPFVRVHALVAGLLAGIAPMLTTPFGVFGHSMGALIAFEFVRQLYRHGMSKPVGLFVAGCRAPSTPHRKAPVYALPDEDLIRELQLLNGTPDDLLTNPGFMRLFLPTLRADFELADTYSYRAGAKPDCPIVAYGGSDDTETLPDELGGWALETGASFVVRMYPGDHFFLETAESSVLRDLAADLLGAPYAD